MTLTRFHITYPLFTPGQPAVSARHGGEPVVRGSRTEDNGLMVLPDTPGRGRCAGAPPDRQAEPGVF